MPATSHNARVSGIEQSGPAWCKAPALPNDERALATRVVVIALSAGGLQPLRVLLRELPSDLGAPVVVVQHITGISQLPSILQARTYLNVQFAKHGEPLRCGRVYVGPPDRHLIINADACLTISDAPRVRFVRPSADWLFESAADVFADRVVAVILSGLQSDGARGAARIKRAGGYVIAQDPRTCAFPDMPSAAIQSGVVDAVLSAEEAGAAIIIALGSRDLAAKPRERREPFAPN